MKVSPLLTESSLTLGALLTTAVQFLGSESGFRISKMVKRPAANVLKKPAAAKRPARTGFWELGLWELGLILPRRAICIHVDCLAQAMANAQWKRHCCLDYYDDDIM